MMPGAIMLVAVSPGPDPQVIVRLFQLYEGMAVRLPASTPP